MTEDEKREVLEWLGQWYAKDRPSESASLATMQAVLAAIEWERSRDKWRPIETAPKDGTVILTRCGANVSVRYWGEGEDDIEAWQPRIRGVFPTHWQPLPAPPKDTQVSDKEKP